MAVDPLARSKPAASSGTPAALQMPTSSKKPDISLVLDFGKTTGWKMQPSVKGKADATPLEARKIVGGIEVEMQKIMFAAGKGSGKTVQSVDIRNAWFFDELRNSGKLRTLIFSYDDVTKSSLVTFYGQKRCVEKGLVGKRGVISIEDIEREGNAWLEENNITIWEFAKPVREGDTVVYPGFNEQILDTATFIIGETGRVGQQYLTPENRPHILIVDRCSSLHMGIGTAHALNLANKKPGDKVADYEWGFRTAAMNVLMHLFESIPTHALVYTGIPGDIDYRITVEGETVRKRYYKEPTWMKHWNVDCNLQVEGSSDEPTDAKTGAPIREGAKTYNLWVRTSQTPLVRGSQEIDSTGTGLSSIYEERRPKKKEEQK